MTLGIKESYRLYLQDIDIKLDKFNSKLVDTYEQQKYLLDIITANSEAYEIAGINIDELTIGNKYKFTIPKLKKYHFVGEKASILSTYITAYINTLKVEAICIDSIAQYSQLRVPYTFYRYMFIELNNKFSKAILLGNLINLGLGMGIISIREKKRNFDYERASKVVNWFESNKYKKELIQEGKTPYDSVSAPDGIKWHIYYTDDYSYWWWWEIQVGMPNASYYKFIPTKYMNGITRNVKDFFKNFNTADKILNTTLLGNIEKLHKFRELCPDIILSYRLNSE